MKTIKQFGELLKSILYVPEKSCILCGRNEGPVCSSCQKDYFLPELERCSGCGKLISPDKTYCSDCVDQKGPKRLNKVTALGYYSGAWKEYIWKIKFKSQPLRIREIAAPLSEWAIRHLPPADGIAAVPLHSSRMEERGFNQAEVIASLLHWELGLPLMQGLIRKLPTKSQVGLSRQERMNNLRGAFSIENNRAFKGKSIWLVDDVTTTGATLEACAAALKESGAEEVYAICLAAGKEKTLVTEGN